MFVAQTYWAAMSPKPLKNAVFSARLRQARLAAGISQKTLGIQAGIDEFVASTRVNRYEQGKYQPDFDTAARLAAVLRVPLAYFFAQDDRLAELLVTFAALPRRKQDAVLRMAKSEFPSGM
jgi:transcriptional regulator with XRE-family HTH domain